MAAKIIDKTLKRKSIATAALDVIAEKGYHNTRIQDIAVRAGVGKGTVYEYFNSKEEILLEVFENDFTDLMNLEPVMTETDNLEKLLSHFRTALETAADSTPLYKVWFEVWFAGVLDVKHPVHKKVQQVLKQMTQFYTGLIEAGQSQNQINPDIKSKDTAAMLVSAADGLILHYILFNMSYKDYRSRYHEFLNMTKTRLSFVS